MLGTGDEKAVGILSHGRSADWVYVWEDRGSDECVMSPLALNCGLETAFEPQTLKMSFPETCPALLNQTLLFYSSKVKINLKTEWESSGHIRRTKPF